MIQINSSIQLSFNGEEFIITQNKVDYMEEIKLNIVDAQTLGYEIEQIIRCNKALKNIK
jgi:hypothetical protein